MQDRGHCIAKAMELPKSRIKSSAYDPVWFQTVCKKWYQIIIISSSSSSGSSSSSSSSSNSSSSSSSNSSIAYHKRLVTNIDS